MNTKALLISLFLVSSLSGLSNAGAWESHDYDMSGDGTLNYPNEGWITHTAYDGYTGGYTKAFHQYSYHHPSDHAFTLYISGHGDLNIIVGSSAYEHTNHIQYYVGGTPHLIGPVGYTTANSYSGHIQGVATPSSTKYCVFEVLVNSALNTELIAHQSVYVSPNIINCYTVSGSIECLDNVTLYTEINNTWQYLATNDGNSYSFEVIDNLNYLLIFSDGHGYEFTVSGSDIEYDYDACIWVYGYTCGIDTIKLYDNNSQLIDTVYQTSGYDIYEMEIADGQSYTISFYDMGILLCYNQTFTCTGDHVLIDYDRCNWVYPPSPWEDPIIIYLWAGYDYNIVVFKDEHGNFIENSQLAIYDKTDNQYLQKWTDASDGYTLLGARFDTDHDVLLSLRTFDGVFTFDTTYPANGSALVGEENITTTNWTIPIKYNLNVLPVDQYGAALFDVFCGLSEYTPLNPGAFWGMDLSDQGYVAVTNCSGFSMCDIIAEKEGYADYKVEALNWTSKSALVKDYRHNIVMEEE